MNKYIVLIMLIFITFNIYSMYFSNDLRGTFSISHISKTENGETRFNVYKFRTVLNNIDLSPQAGLTRQDQIVAFVSALEDLTNYFGDEQDKPVIHREVIRALLAKKETRSNATCIKQAEIYIRSCFRNTNFMDYPQTTIDIMLDQVPPRERALWTRSINYIIQDIKESHDGKKLFQLSAFSK